MYQLWYMIVNSKYGGCFFVICRFEREIQFIQWKMTWVVIFHCKNCIWGQPPFLWFLNKIERIYMRSPHTRNVFLIATHHWVEIISGQLRASHPSCILQQTVHWTKQSALPSPRMIYFNECHSTKIKLPSGLPARISLGLYIRIAYCLLESIWSVVFLLISICCTRFSLVYSSVYVLNIHAQIHARDYTGQWRLPFSLKPSQHRLFYIGL